jgi:hypothetical protein
MISLFIRRMLLLVIPALLLIALNAAARLADDHRQPIIMGEPGALLFAATFDGEPDSPFNRLWRQYDGRLSARVRDGTLHLQIDDFSAGAYSVVPYLFADFDVSTRARAAAGPEDNGFGLVFRLQDGGNQNTADDSYYLFLISSDGYYRVSRVINGQARIVSDWIDSPAVRLGIGSVNTLRVVGQGDRFAFYINGVRVPLCIPTAPDGISTYALGECIGGALVDTLVDASIAVGRVGVGAVSTESGESGVQVAFEQFIVSAPNAAVGE